MELIDNGTLLQIERVLRENASKGKFCELEVLSILKELGFYSCFFYAAVPNVSTEDYKLFLSAVDGSKKQKTHVGVSVNYKSSAIFMNPDKKSPFKQRADRCHQTPELMAHTELMDVHDKNRVHTPVYYDDELIGALSCAWSGDFDLISDEHKKGLSLVTSLISRYWVLANEVLISKITEQMLAALNTNREFHDISVFIDKIAEQIQATIGAQVVAVFHYNWYSNTLNKVSESYASSIKGSSFPETYCVGKRLTGIAWINKEFRHIPNFHEFLGTHDFHVNSESLDHHCNMLGKVNSILYCPIGKKSQYFLRLMNRDDQHDFPFLTSHKIVIDKICERLGRILDDATTDNQLANLQLVSKSAITHIEKFTLTAQSIKRALEDECVTELGIMAYDGKYNHFCHKYFTDDLLNSSLVGFVEWKSDKLYSACVDATKITAFRISDFPERTNDAHLAGILYKKKINFITVVPFSSLRIKGFILIPSPVNVEGNAAMYLDRIPKHHASSLKAYAAVIGGCVESADSHLTSENARRLVGQIGHEIQGPVAALGQSAIYMLYQLMEFQKASDATSDNVARDISNSVRRDEILIDRQMRQINTLMDVAVDMAQESNGVIQVHFKQYSLYKVMLAASREALRDDYLDCRDVRHKIVFEFNDAAKEMKDITGDTNLLHRVFVNLFRNAIKYSLPRYKGQDIVIKVHGNPQTELHIVRVINWGIPIHNDIKEIIFNAFERGDSHDKLKARRGMGLGLYIARRFLAAHKGDIYCVESKPTLDDPNRKKLEGYETTFEIRLPHGRPIGTYDDCI